MEEPHVSFVRDKEKGFVFDTFLIILAIGICEFPVFCLNSQPWEKEFLGVPDNVLPKGYFKLQI